jgi:hypothetical protein
MVQVNVFASENRAIEALLSVLPQGVTVSKPHQGRDDGHDVVINGLPIEIKWTKDGSLGGVRQLLEFSRQRPQIVVARELAPGARQLLSDEHIGWVDETGAAEIAMPTLVVSRSGRSKPPTPRSNRWTPSVMATAEALLCGTRATVDEAAKATGLSVGSCTRALRLLTDGGLLEADGARGRMSARRIVDQRELLNAYVGAVQATPPGESITVGVLWRDVIDDLERMGRRWSHAGIEWAVSGLAAAGLLAPLLSTISTAEVYIEAASAPGLVNAARTADVEVIEGGRLTLRPMPTRTTYTLASVIDDVRVAPWPRVYVDLLRAGVRGEEAAEHLLEVVNG